jgi:hypothetical protein
MTTENYSPVRIAWLFGEPKRKAGRSGFRLEFRFEGKRTFHLAASLHESTISIDMPKTLRQLRSKRFRLLASLLVMLAILCNGIGLAQAHAIETAKDCCAEMSGHGKAMSHCDEESRSPHPGCDDQCMARCMSANALLSVPLIIVSNVLIATPLPQLKTSDHFLAEFGPGLRPPIYS